MFTLPNPDLMIGVGRDISDLNLSFFKVLCSRHTSNAEVPKLTRGNMFSGFPCLVGPFVTLAVAIPAADVHHCAGRSYIRDYIPVILKFT